MKTVLFFIALLLTTPAFSSAENETPYQKALGLLRQGKSAEAYPLLESISLDSEESKLSLVELQKLHYQRQEWDKFFAYAVFYRQKLLADPSLWQKNFSSRMISLEILALTKQCQWESAHQVGQLGLKIAQTLQSPEIAEIEHALVYLPPLQKLKNIQGPPKETSIPHSIQRRTRYWPIQTKTLSAIEHPKFLRLKVENRCSND